MSVAAQKRQDIYERAVSALHRINPNAVPIAKPSEPFAIERVTQQARDTSPPTPADPSPERMLVSRCSNMQNAIAELVARGKRKGMKIELPVIDDADLGARLQKLNAAHDDLESAIIYHDSTTPEQRAINVLRGQVSRLEKRVDAMGAALAAVAELLPLLMKGNADAK